MNLDIDGGKLLYALGVLFALGAFLYFVRDVVFGLSLTVTAALLCAAFIVFFIGGITIDRGGLCVVSFALAAIAYAVFLGYVVTRYELAETGVFLMLAASAVLFVGLGYAVRERELAVPRRTAGYVVIGVLCVSLVLVGADVMGGDVTYTAELDQEVTVTIPDERAGDREFVPVEAPIGSVTASNEFVFTRPLDLPSVRGCVVGTDAVADGEAWIRYDQRSYERSNRIGGGETRTFGLTAELPMITNRTDEEADSRTVSFAIERSPDCEVTRSEPTILIVFENERRPVPV